MKFMKFELIVCILFSLLFCSACNMQAENKSGIINPDSVANTFSADIYCFCLGIIGSFNKSNFYESSCTTTFSYLYYKDILAGHGEFRHIENRDTLTRIRNLIYNGERVKNDYPDLGELNFVLIFRGQDNRTDSFSFKPRNMNSLSMNKDSAINYGFNVLDSMAKILGRKNMSYPSPVNRSF